MMQQHTSQAGGRSRLWIIRAALVASAMALVWTGSDASAQTTRVGAVVQVVAPSASAGNITVHGLAADCETGQPPIRVAIYDGPDASAPYIADAALDTAADLGLACPGRTGMARIGFTAIFNSRLLSDGLHPLTFWAEYPNGTVAVGGAHLMLDNTPAYEVQESGSD